MDVEVSTKWALTRASQVTAQFIMYRKNCAAKSHAPLRVHEVEPLLREEEEGEELELSALRDADRRPGRRDGAPCGGGTAQSGSMEVFFKETGSWAVTPAGSQWRLFTNCRLDRPLSWSTTADGLEQVNSSRVYTSYLWHPLLTKLSSNSTWHAVTPTQPTVSSSTRHVPLYYIPAWSHVKTF